MLSPLPIDKFIPEILSKLEGVSNLVLKASPGSGKTTRLPPALLELKGFDAKSEVWVLEPRRLAAKLACTRVAEERGIKIGEEIGYQFRNEKRVSLKTRLTFLTEGLFIRRCLTDPKLSNVKIVILDEFHERHLQTDVALAYLKHLQSTLRPDLKILILSATLDTQSLESYLGNTITFEVDAPLHPVSIHYRDPGERVEEGMARAIRDSLKDNSLSGHVLAFLPGMRELKRTEEVLRGFVKNPLFLLHGDLTKEEQELAFKPSRERKVILSTNIAESSVTVDGVRIVVDAGLERVASLSPWTGLSSLSTKKASRASLIQRTGRAGRQGPGVSIRLFSEHDFETRPPYSIPEIRRADLSQTLLELYSLGISRWDTFPWFEKPDTNQIAGAHALLQNLKALHEGELTALGRKMAEMPLHPRLSKLVLEALENGCFKKATRVAALLSEGELGDIDLLQMAGRPPTFRIKQFEERLQSTLSWKTTAAEDEGRLAQCLLKAFPDRVGRRREEKGGQGKFFEIVLSEGGSVLAEDIPLIRENTFFIVLDAEESKRLGTSKSLTFARALVPIEEAWLLESPALKDCSDVAWDSKREEVVLRNRLVYGQLVLEESLKPCSPNPNALQLFLKEGLKLKKEEPSWPELIQALAPFGEVEEHFLRILFLVSQRKWKAVTPKEFVASLLETFSPSLSLKALRKVDWENFVKLTLIPDHFQEADRLVPTHFELHKKRRVKIHYSLDKAPWIESRLQDFFGVRENPAVLGNQVPLVLHLLAPNQRAVQVTQDLKGFWERHYPALRGELSRRYPRHAWPLNPLSPLSE